jgi:hypothetical protein
MKPATSPAVSPISIQSVRTAPAGLHRFVKGPRMVSVSIRLCCVAMACVTACGLSSSAAAQEFRIYTTVEPLKDAKDSRPAPKITSSISLTLFHAGKVYDYLQTSEETVISEPAHNRFLVLSKRRNLATAITQDEIRRFLGLAQSHARDLIQDLQRQGTEHQAAIDAIEFQLVPEFEVRDDPKARKLTLDSPQLRYDVSYEAPPSPEISRTYLKTADWTAQLNSVLHPHNLLPEPRMRLNDELRKRNAIPRIVDLEIKGEHPVRLQARHEWTFKLNPRDRQLIDAWESQLRQPGFRTIPFQEFQQQTLTSNRRR